MPRRAVPRHRGARAVCVALALAAALPAAGQSPPGGRRLVYGGDAAFPPYEYLDQRGQPAGLNVELIRAVGRLKGMEVTVRLMPWSALREELAAGRVDVAAMYRSTTRARLVDFAIPHELVYHELFVRRGARPVASLADLAGRTVLVQADALAADALDELGLGPGLRRVASEPEALEALARGEGEVAVVTQVVGRPFRERADLGTRIVASGPPVLLSEYAFVTAPGRRDLLELLNEGVAELKSRGEYDALYQQWVQPDRSAERVRLAGWALMAALAATLLVALWNRSLRRRVAALAADIRREFEEKERAQAALARTERSLRTAQKLEAIGRLTGGVAHDFNNVLGIILSYATFVREQLVEERLPTADIDEVLMASERAARLTRQLLAFSRTTPMEMSTVDLGAVVVGMRSLLQRLVGSGVTLVLQVPPTPLWVRSEPSLVEQVLLNLAANGRDAMAGPGGRLEVTAEARPAAPGERAGVAAGPHLALAVADDGAGMDEATQERIFDPFFTTKEEGRGTGLGLATVLANVTRLGGQVQVRSAPGRGSTFTVLLPAAPAPAAVPEAAAPEAVPGRGRRVLLVEDDEALRRAARLWLERAGYSVQDAADGKAARALAVPLPEVLVTDVITPPPGGVALAAELRRQRPGLPVLFVSGYVGQDVALDLQAPATAFLAKPYTGAALVAALGRLLGG